MIKILILEDDILFAQTLEDFLSEEGFDITLAHDGERASELCYEQHFDLLLLDVNVPKKNGFELLKSIRKNRQDTPTIFITSFNNKESLKEGFLSGADDYLTKPIDLDELLMRIIALLKRANIYQKTIEIGDALYTPQKHQLSINNQDIILSNKVALLLELLISNQNSIVTKEQIYDKLWKWDEEPSSASLRVYINELKKLLGKDKILNHKGIGYSLAP